MLDFALSAFLAGRQTDIEDRMTRQMFTKHSSCFARYNREHRICFHVLIVHHSIQNIARTLPRLFKLALDALRASCCLPCGGCLRPSSQLGTSRRVSSSNEANSHVSKTTRLSTSREWLRRTPYLQTAKNNSGSVVFVFVSTCSRASMRVCSHDEALLRTMLICTGPSASFFSRATNTC